MILTELLARLGLDIDAQSFAKGQIAVEILKKSTEKLVDAVQFAASAIPRMIGGVVASADAFDEASQSSGVAVGALQELTYAAGFSGMTLESLQGSLGILTRQMGAAKDGSEEVTKSFRKVGVAIKGADGELRPAEDVLMDLADAFSTMEDGSQKTALSMKFFGKSGAGMIPFLNAGREGIAQARAEAQRLGLVLDDVAIKAGAEVDDNITRLSASLTGLRNQVIGPLLPVINETVQGFLKWVAANRALLKSSLLTAIKAFGTGFLLMARVLKAVAVAILLVIKYFKLLATIWAGTILAQHLSIIALQARMAGGYYALAKAALFSGRASLVAGLQMAKGWLIAFAPMAFIIAGVAAFALILEDIWVWLNGGESAIGNLIASWGEWIDELLVEDANDPWWVVMIKDLVFMITHLGTVWDSLVTLWRVTLGAFFDWLSDKVAEIFGWIDRSVQKVTGAVKTVTDYLGGGTDAERALAQAGGGAQFTNTRGVKGIPQMTGPFNNTSTLGAGGRGGVRVQNSPTYHITGANAQEIADKVAETNETWFERKLSEAM